MSDTDTKAEDDIQAVLASQKAIALDVETAASSRVAAAKLFLSYVAPEQEQQREEIKNLSSDSTNQVGLFDDQETSDAVLNSPAFDQKIQAAVEQAFRVHETQKL